MSEDWNIYCRDCRDTHYFSDANHQVELMRGLIKHSDVIAGLQPLMADHGEYITFSAGHYGHIDVGWFAKHRGHALVAVSEYGKVDMECNEYVRCGDCGRSMCCRLEKGHVGEHKAMVGV